MTPPDQATVIIHRPDDMFVWAARSFAVRIDGRRAGKIRLGSFGVFPVEPGPHTVLTSIDWNRSMPLTINAASGSRVVLKIQLRRSFSMWRRVLLPIVIAVLIGLIASGVLASLLFGGEPNLWERSTAFFVVYILVIMAHVVLTPIIVKDYWSTWTLEKRNG